MGKEISQIKKFLHSLKRAGWNIERAIIFGSRVRGDYLEGSDIDLILVSNDFEGIFLLTGSQKSIGFGKAPSHLNFFAIPELSLTKRRG